MLFLFQWRWPRPVFLVYRLALGIYAVFALTEDIVSWKKSAWQHHVLVFLTTWTYILLTAYFLLGAVLALLYYIYQRHFRTKYPNIAPSKNHLVEKAWAIRRLSRQKVNPAFLDAARKVNAPPNSDTASSANGDSPPVVVVDSAVDKKEQNGSDVKTPTPRPHSTPRPVRSSPPDKRATSMLSEVTLPWYIQLYWLLGNIVQVFSVIVTVIYFSVLFPAKPDHSSVSLHDVNVHMLNTGFMVLDAMIGARPVRMLHVIYPLLYGVAYVVFSVIYWSRDPEHNVVYKKVLDWSHPGLTVGVVCGLAVIAIPLLQLLFFAAYQLRLIIYRHVYKKDYFKE